MTMTRPDLRYALFIVSQYFANFDFTYVAAVIQILKYVRSTLHYSLTYTKDQMGFVGYINPDWSGTIDRRESISGCLFMLG